jgi:membrane-bound lytic murein transglycosylase D
MKLIKKWFIWINLVLGVIIYSSCSTMVSYISPEGDRVSEQEAVSSQKELIENNPENSTPAHQPTEIASYSRENNVSNNDDYGQPSKISDDPIENHGDEAVDEVIYTNISDEETDDPDNENNLYDLTDQELIDTALGYCQASIDFWEKGDLDNATDALDKAYSLILKVNGGDNPEIQQEKEDLRLTISKRILEVHASRFTVANGFHTAIPLEMNSHVQKALDLFKGNQKEFFLAAYARSGRYRPAILEALKEAGLPEELSWLPLIESGYKVRALSSARALGMWQFIASTGYRFGLKRDTWIDERMDPEKATNAAIAYLSELHQMFGDWTTVLASYNCGEARVSKLIKSQKIDYLDNFWDLYEKLPSETAFYIPKFLAVLHIINDPEAHGFTLPPVEDPVEYEEININKQVLLKTIADRIDIEYSELEDLNPELRQDITPKTAYSLKVPKGKGEILLAQLNDIPAYSPPVQAYVTHKVKSGDSLSVIAERYKTSISAIMNMNGLKSRNYLMIGWNLKIPTQGGSSAIYLEEGQVVEYVVKKGDSLWKIANNYNTTINAIQSINNLKSTTLQIGQILKISAVVASVGSGNTQEYIVQKGDSPYLIAKRYSMNLSEFLTLNSLTPRSTIYPGQVLRIVAK